MSVLNIVTPKDANAHILKHPAARVRNFNAGLHKLLDDMTETMRKAPGAGLAGPQVGVGQRIAVIEWPEDEDKPEETLRHYELINPEILKAKGEEVGTEGCLSLPGLAADVKRATYVLVRTYDRSGRELRLKAYDWLARIIQHEIDHLQGIMMTDKAEQLYRIVENEKGEAELIPIEKTI